MQVLVEFVNLRNIYYALAYLCILGSYALKTQFKFCDRASIYENNRWLSKYRLIRLLEAYAKLIRDALQELFPCLVLLHLDVKVNRKCYKHFLS